MAVLAIVLGGFLLLLPVGGVTVGMVREFGWRQVASIWGLVLAVFAVCMTGSWLLTYGIEHA